MIRGARPRRRPPETALAFADLHIIDAGLAAAHQAVLVEFPLLIAVGAEPLSGAVMPFYWKLTAMKLRSNADP
jgi:hypothetical protein